MELLQTRTNDFGSFWISGQHIFWSCYKKVGSSKANLIEGPLWVALDKLAPWKEEPGREPESLKKTCS